MGRKIKLIKKQSVSQGSKGDRDFVAHDVIVVNEDHVLSTIPGQEEEEITDLKLLRVAKDIEKIDRKAFRAGLQRLDELRGGSAGMTSDEKEFVGQTFSFSNPADLISQFPDVRDRINNGLFSFHKPAVKAREERFEFAASIIYNTVNPAAADTIINKFITPQTVNNIDMWTAFVKFGKEGSKYGDAACYIMDYVLSMGDFLNAGLLEDITGNMQAVPGNLTASEVILAVENALIDGNFIIP